MISNQILQTNIEGLKGITRVDLCICDTEGKVLASTFTGAEEYESAILAFEMCIRDRYSSCVYVYCKRM